MAAALRAFLRALQEVAVPPSGSRSVRDGVE